MTSIQKTAIIKSPLIGAEKGTLFDDIDNVVGPNNASINTTNPIKSIRVIYAEVVNGLIVEYRETEGSTVVQAHGTTPDSSGKLDTGLKEEVIQLRNTQVVIAVTGMHGETRHSDSLGGRRVAQITFVLYDRIDGTVEVRGPFGSLASTPFSVTADGIFVAFGGYAFNQTQSVAHKPAGGLFGLTLHDVADRSI
ncbi:hypothetical protein B0H19DRAFT_1261130 [Mycena capillaripes]|nr:hypothetical protein B0H19DRAFT_1261130 [Mycena capillaripes]